MSEVQFHRIPDNVPDRGDGACAPHAGIAATSAPVATLFCGIELVFCDHKDLCDKILFVEKGQVIAILFADGRMWRKENPPCP